MSRKLTYEELKQKLKVLENETLASKKNEEALRESEAQKKAILDASVGRIRLFDMDLQPEFIMGEYRPDLPDG